VQTNPGERPTAALITPLEARKYYHMAERDLRRAIGYGLIRTMVVRADVEAFLEKWGRTRPVHPGCVKQGVAK
jgi:hypothetical protein